MHQLLGFAVILILIFPPICNNLRFRREDRPHVLYAEVYREQLVLFNDW